MLKLLLYTALFGIGSYYLVSAIPQSYKEKTAAAMGLYKLKDYSFEIFNPAGKREQLLEKLEANITKVKKIQNAGSTIKIEGDALTSEINPILEESQTLLTEIQKLNPKTGLLPNVMGKILGVENPPPADAINADQITPELKTQICK